MEPCKREAQMGPGRSLGRAPPQSPAQEEAVGCRAQCSEEWEQLQLPWPGRRGTVRSRDRAHTGHPGTHPGLGQAIQREVSEVREMDRPFPNMSGSWAFVSEATVEWGADGLILPPGQGPDPPSWATHNGTLCGSAESQCPVENKLIFSGSQTGRLVDQQVPVRLSLLHPRRVLARCPSGATVGLSLCLCPSAPHRQGILEEKRAQTPPDTPPSSQCGLRPVSSLLGTGAAEPGLPAVAAWPAGAWVCRALGGLWKGRVLSALTLARCPGLGEVWGPAPGLQLVQRRSPGLGRALPGACPRLHCGASARPLWGLWQVLRVLGEAGRHVAVAPAGPGRHLEA
ncbi:uncharacterized protein LOC110348732 [Heterocephalus glaber]|uniref:Uncharacterized protein LOC110348732 n=1 Tax=Heterocephalus glaber TaxID=10181 RepID=A0AAX6SUZ1_HETGA|nr:uncharacterized protein LOC110348732 [Heterocephalus glaber]